MLPVAQSLLLHCVHPGECVQVRVHVHVHVLQHCKRSSGQSKTGEVIEHALSKMRGLRCIVNGRLHI